MDLQQSITRFLFLHLVNTLATIAAALTSIAALIIALIALGRT